MFKEILSQYFDIIFTVQCPLHKTLKMGVVVGTGQRNVGWQKTYR